MPAYEADLERFEGYDAQVLGISMDTLETQTKFAESLNLPFPLLADPDGTAAKAYGAVATPHVFIFDQERRLRFSGRIDDAENPEKTKTRVLSSVENNRQQMGEALEEIRLIRELRPPYNLSALDQRAAEFLLDGRDLRGVRVEQMVRRGVAHVPEDRTHVGSAPSLSITDNLIMKQYGQPPIGRGPSSTRRSARGRASRTTRRLRR